MLISAKAKIINSVYTPHQKEIENNLLSLLSKAGLYAETKKKKPRKMSKI